MDSIPDSDKCIIQINSGPICGKTQIIHGKSYNKFQSIPYAKPPLGQLRFMPPQPIKPWTDLRDCTTPAPWPIGYDFVLKTIRGSEDCLYLEISTPTLRPDKPLPVMFWIGCLGFYWTMDGLFDHTTINDENIIFVRCGFRLGPFGFLSIQDITAPGNCGLKDLVMALKWVNQNIGAFGGDPNNVTIFGNSAGGAIIHFMMFSPMATGLFHKAIIQSASALNNWSLDKNPSPAVVEMGKLLGIDKRYKMEIVEELRLITAQKIMESFVEMTKKNFADQDHFYLDFVFKPCIEVEFEGQPAFLTRTPASILKSGNFNKVPLIIGSNNVEGEILQYKHQDFYSNFEKYNENVCLLVPKTLSGESKFSKNIGQQLMKFYLGDEEQLTADTKTQYLQIISDYYFLYYVNKTVSLHSQFASECPVYYYIINYAGEWKVPPTLKFFNSMGHISEVPFLFRIQIPGEPVIKGSRDSIKTRCRVVKMWTNFAKYGNPTPDESDQLLQITWDPVESKDKLNYLSIGMELTKGTNPFQDRMAFWDDLHREHTFLRALVYFNDMGVSW